MDPGHARHLLEERRRSMRHLVVLERTTLEAGTQDDIFSDLSSTDQHQADGASELFERERDATILRMAEELATDIDLALAKLDTGRFGTCEACGEPIPDERLEARPEARFCEADERRWELASMALGVSRDGDTAPEPGWRNLDLLPADEPGEEPNPLDPEELALHQVRPDRTLTAPEIEEAEARLLGELDREREGSAAEEEDDRRAVDEAARLEEELGS